MTGDMGILHLGSITRGDPDHGYRKMARDVMALAITDAKIGLLDRVSGELRPYRHVSYMEDTWRRPILTQARAWLTEWSPALTIWCAWLGLDWRDVTQHLRGVVADVEAQERDYVRQRRD